MARFPRLAEARPDDADELEAGFVATKRAMPRPPPGYVHRARLFDLLDDRVAHAALTLVRAPAGTGKTALVSAWAGAGRAPGPVAWLSLAPGDNTRSRFWRQVVLALAEAVDDDSFHVAFSSTAGIDQLLAEMVGAVAERTEPVVLVLDDVHELSDPELLADLDRLLRSPPRGVRIIATARWDLPLHLSRLRLSGAVAQIGGDDLAFSLEEGAALFATSGVELDETGVRRVWERTEGWAAGLALTALALHGRADPDAFVREFSGGIAPVADYLLEEVLADESPQVRRFLLMTSVVDEVCGELADAMTGGSSGGTMLADLHQRGVLTSALDDHLRWFRYHGLLAGMLRAMLRREAPADLARELHARAARWLVAHGRVVPGARHAAAAGDVELLADIAADHAFALSARGEVADLGAVIRTLPDEAVRSKPMLMLTLAGAALEAGDGAGAAVWLDLVDRTTAPIPEHRQGPFAVGRALTRLYEARITGDMRGAVEAARPFLEPSARLRLHRPEVEAVVLINLGAVELWTGDVAGARAHLEVGVAAAEAIDLGFLALLGLSLLAIVDSWSEDLPAAGRTATRALELADEHGWRGTPRAGIAIAVLSYVAAEDGDLEGAERLQEEADRAMGDGIELSLRGQTVLPRARLARLRGRPREARRQAADARVALHGTPFLPPIESYLVVEEALSLADEGQAAAGVAMLEEALGPHAAGGHVPVTLAMMLVERGADERALALATPWADPDAATMVNVRLDALLVLARVRHRAGDPAWSDAAEGALALAHRHGRRTPFLEHGPQLAGVLADHRGSTAFGPFLTEVEALIDPPAASSPETPPLLDELSDRELAVLRYLPTMLSNREIADELIVSVNTVKTHVRSIYAKLGTHDRRDAVRRARRLGLLG